MQSPSSASPVPVFIFPNTVNFYLGDQKSFKQVITVYNVYDTAVRFRVLSTAPDKYTVVDPEGSIKPHCSLDIVIRHNDVKPANCNISDKFRIQLLDISTKKVLSIKDVYATLNSGYPEDREGSHDSEKYSEFRPAKSGIISEDHIGKHRSGPNSLVILIGLVCIVGLLLPNEGEQGYSSIHLSWSIKLILAYVLGLVTMVVLQS